MPDPSRTRVSSADALGELLDCAPALLDTTLDQLRTLLVVRETGSALRAARTLGREQSSVQKQIDTLNRNFLLLSGEVLTIKQGRGKDVLFTPTGEAVAGLAERTLTEWIREIHTSRRRNGGTITVGTTEFTLQAVSRGWERLAGEFQRREVEFKVVHVRTKDLWSRLESKAMDLVCGSVIAGPDEDPRLKDYDVIEFVRGRPVLLTNLSRDELPLTRIDAGRLPELPLVVPAAGLIAEFLVTWYGPNYRAHLDIAADIDDVHYGLSLLRSGLVRGCMLVAQTLGNRKAAEPGLRTIDLRDDLAPGLEIMTGAFVRRHDRARYEPDHPLNLLWDAMRTDATNRATST